MSAAVLRARKTVARIRKVADQLKPMPALKELQSEFRDKVELCQAPCQRPKINPVTGKKDWQCSNVGYNRVQIEHYDPIKRRRVLEWHYACWAHSPRNRAGNVIQFDRAKRKFVDSVVNSNSKR